MLERAAILCDGGLITAEHLAIPAAPGAGPRPAAAASRDIAASVIPPAVRHEPAGSEPGAHDLAAVERALIAQALQDARFNKSKAAKALGLTRHQLYIRMRRHGMES